MYLSELYYCKDSKSLFKKITILIHAGFGKDIKIKMDMENLE